jgi:hypothetical protein
MCGEYASGNVSDATMTPVGINSHLEAGVVADALPGGGPAAGGVQRRRQIPQHLHVRARQHPQVRDVLRQEHVMEFCKRRRAVQISKQIGSQAVWAGDTLWLRLFAVHTFGPVHLLCSHRYK